MQGSLRRQGVFGWATGLAVVATLTVLTVGAQAAAPVVISAPTVKGVYMEGEILGATSGRWTGAPPFTYEYDWQRCNNGGGDCRLIGVPSGSTYTVTAADVGFRIRTWVKATGQDCTEPVSTTGLPICVARTGEGPSEQTPVIAANPKFRPSSTAPPTVTGTAEERSTLTAADGQWSGIEPITTARQWERCSAAGDACEPIPDATAATYVLARADVAKTIRVVVTASNVRGGSDPVASSPTGVVRAFLPRPGRATIGVGLVELPDKLVIDRVVLTPSTLRALGPVTARFRVSDTRGFRIRGALVRVVAVPAGLVAPVADARTDAEGWARLRLVPTPRVVLRRGGSIQLLASAFKPGTSPRGGISAQRLVKLPLGVSR